jgi:hypothetical protein
LSLLLFSSFVIGPTCLRRLNIFALALFCTAADQNDNVFAILGEVNPVAVAEEFVFFFVNVASQLDHWVNGNIFVTFHRAIPSTGSGRLLLTAAQRIITNKPLFYILGIFAVMGLLQAGPQDPCGFVAASNANRSLALEQRRIELEERKVYPPALQGSEMTEE